MKFLLFAGIVVLLQSCTHNPHRKEASDKSTCGLDINDSIQERINSCNFFYNPSNIPDFILVARLPEKVIKLKPGKINYNLYRSEVYKDKQTELIWSSSASFSGSLEEAITYCDIEVSLKNYFPHLKWRLPTFNEAKDIFYRRSNNSNILDRMLVSKKNEDTGFVKYYDYKIIQNEIIGRQYDPTDSVIVCVAQE